MKNKSRDKKIEKSCSKEKANDNFFIKKILNNIEELVSPRNLYCICCESFIGENNLYGLCTSCFHKISWNKGKCCIKCGRMLKDNALFKICEDCKETIRYFDKGYSATSYNLIERKIVSRFKNEKKRHIGLEIANIIQDKLISEVDNGNIDLISYPPISDNKMRHRGFNQSEVIAKFLSKQIKVKTRELFYLDKEKKDMKILNKYERIENISNKIKVKEYNKSIVKDKKILLIDDVFTTGATLNECSKVLKEEGAKKVFFLVFSSVW